MKQDIVVTLQIKFQMFIVLMSPGLIVITYISTVRLRSAIPILKCNCPVIFVKGILFPPIYFCLGITAKIQVLLINCTVSFLFLGPSGEFIYLLFTCSKTGIVFVHTSLTMS